MLPVPRSKSISKRNPSERNRSGTKGTRRIGALCTAGYCCEYSRCVEILYCGYFLTRSTSGFNIVKYCLNRSNTLDILSTPKYFECLYCGYCLCSRFCTAHTPVLAVFGPAVLFILRVLAVSRPPVLQ